MNIAALKVESMPSIVLNGRGDPRTIMSGVRAGALRPTDAGCGFSVSARPERMRSIWRDPLPTCRRAEHDMGMPATEHRRWTADEVRAMPEDGNRYEVIDGELHVSPPPKITHESLVVRVVVALDPYVREQRIGYLFASRGEVAPDPDTLVEPDVFVLPPVNGRRPASWKVAGTPVLVVEVLSPSSVRRDRTVKRRLYQRMGVEYWIVDPDARLVERWMPADTRAEVCEEELLWHPFGAVELYRLQVNALFAAALDG